MLLQTYNYYFSYATIPLVIFDKIIYVNANQEFRPPRGERFGTFPNRGNRQTNCFAASRSRETSLHFVLPLPEAGKRPCNLFCPFPKWGNLPSGGFN
jgi:hypothetical protein